MSNPLKLSDGRVLEYIDNGVLSKSALILHHGTPTSMTVWNTWLAAAAEKGIRAIAFTRPGYAGSDRKVDHRIIDSNDDLNEILNQLEVEKFVSVGWSGGGPYALASGLLNRCTGVQLIASVSPYDAEDFDWFQDSTPEMIEETKVSAKSLEDCLAFKEGYYTGLRDMTAEQLLVEYEKRSSFKLFETAYREFSKDLCFSMHDALRDGALGYAEDEFAFLRNWGFETKDVIVSVVIWQGLDDQSVSPHMARWLNANIQNPTLELLEGQHHGSIMVENREEILNAAIRALSA
jgi:pimeloyl-ACP methyl ester carboxylesterase